MSTLARRITVQEAQLRTAAVEIKSLTIKGKQMTLAVFRQLEDDDVIEEETGELVGTIWGRVNYFWGECKEGDHLHIVWQYGDELRRACAYRRPKGVPIHLLKAQREALHCLYLTLLLKESTTPATAQSRYGANNECRSFGKGTWPSGEEMEFILPDALAREIAPHSMSGTIYAGHLTKAEEKFRRLAKADNHNTSTAYNTHIAIEMVDTRIQVLTDRWRHSYTACMLSDHLFIAV